MGGGQLEERVQEELAMMKEEISQVWDLAGEASRGGHRSLLKDDKSVM